MNDTQLEDDENQLADRCFAAYQIERYDEAIEFGCQALANDPANAFVLAILSDAALRTNAFDLARQASENLIRCAPTYGQGYINLAWAIWLDASYSPQEDSRPDRLLEPSDSNNSRIAMVENLIQAALQADPENAYAHFAQAELEHAHERHSEALESAEEGLRIDPTNSHGLRLRLRALSKLDRDKESVIQAKAILAQEPEDPFSHHHLATSYFNARQFDQASVHARLAVRGEPNNTEYQATYWDSLSAIETWFKPFLNYRLFIERIQRFPKPILITAITVSVIAYAVILFAFAGKENISNYSILLIALGAIIPWLASPQPAQAITDAVFYVRNAQFRAAVDKGNIVLECCLTLLGISFLACFAAGGFEIYWPMLIFLALAVMAPVTITAFFAEPKRWLLFIIPGICIVAWLLATGYSIANEYEPNDPRRANFFYPIFGAVFLTVAIPTFYLNVQHRISEAKDKGEKILPQFMPRF
ncbi:MAG: hypothetical protein AAF664_03840 [Planctomycetota bacterium]